MNPRNGPGFIGPQPLPGFLTSPRARATSAALHVDRDAELLAEAVGEPDVVGVAVGQHDRPDVGLRPAHRRELALEVAVLAGHPGVDDR